MMLIRGVTAWGSSLLLFNSISFFGVRASAIAPRRSGSYGPPPQLNFAAGDSEEFDGTSFLADSVICPRVPGSPTFYKQDLIDAFNSDRSFDSDHNTLVGGKQVHSGILLVGAFFRDSREGSHTVRTYSFDAAEIRQGDIYFQCDYPTGPSEDPKGATRGFGIIASRDSPPPVSTPPPKLNFAAGDTENFDLSSITKNTVTCPKAPKAPSYTKEQLKQAFNYGHEYLPESNRFKGGIRIPLGVLFVVAEYSDAKVNGHIVRTFTFYEALIRAAEPPHNEWECVYPTNAAKGLGTRDVLPADHAKQA